MIHFHCQSPGYKYNDIIRFIAHKIIIPIG